MHIVRTNLLPATKKIRPVYIEQIECSPNAGKQ